MLILLFLCLRLSLLFSLLLLSILLLLLLSLLSEVCNPKKGWSVTESSQTWKYFNPGSQAALRRMLSD